jgi:hypothetical protein
MLREALEYLLESGQRATALDVVQIPGDPTRVILHNHHEGTQTDHELPPPRRNHAITNRLDFVAFAQRKTLVASAPGLDEDPVCWINRQGATLILDDDRYRQNHVVWAFDRTRQAGWLDMVDEAANPMLEPTELITVIRRVLGLTDCPLISALRHVDWETAKQTRTIAERGKESLGQTISAKVSTLEAIPEQITVSVPLFEGGICPKSDISCLVEIDAPTAKVGLFPRPGQMREAYDAAVNFIANDLTNDFDGALPLYRGSANA